MKGTWKLIEGVPLYPLSSSEAKEVKDYMESEKPKKTFSQLKEEAEEVLRFLM